jgi:DNA replication initiation complex subunit (GINS family)
MITYNDIYELLRKERYSEQIQQLPKNFVEEVAVYIVDKKNIAEKGVNLFSEASIKTKRQVENVISMFNELMLRRKKKILNLAFIAAETGISKRDFENLLSFEQELLNKIIKAIEESEKEVSSLLNGKKEEKVKNRLIVFLEDTEEFVGLEGEKLGPYKKREIANLPIEIADILKADSKAEFVEED